MNQIVYTTGDKVNYCLYDKKSEPHWFKGTVHGVRQLESPSGVILKTTYLIDTGRDDADYAYDDDEGRQPEQLEVPADRLRKAN